MSAELKAELTSLVGGTHGKPGNILGAHPMKGGEEMVVRTFQPQAQSVRLLCGEADPVAMERIHDAGVFEAKAPTADVYQLEVTDGGGSATVMEDPYRFPGQITDMDLYLHGEGTHYRTYEKMGAHPLVLDGVAGVYFAVWAPNASRVSVVGDFNQWDGRHHPMQGRGESGLWELFLPGFKVGDIYKYEVQGRNGYLETKADPYGFAAELRPNTASKVWDHSMYAWKDEAWMESRQTFDWQSEPISVYEVHLGSWRHDPERGEEKWLTYREFADTLIPHVKDLGFTHIELLPVTEHPFDGSWGYQTIGYYAATSRFGSPDDLKYMIDRAHELGIGVILDWVPAHFPKDGHGLAYFDGTHLYEHSDPRMGEHMDWGTLIFNYGRNEVRTFLLSNATYWAEVFHIDGIRVDAVASMLYLDYSREEGQWVPNKYGGRENLEAVAFLRQFNEVIHAEYPGFMTFAEESTAWPMVSRPTYLGGLGFDMKWNMGWMNDTLEYIEKESIHRKYHHNEITFSLVYAFTENFILPFSHDEVVHGKQSMLSKMPGDDWQQFANLRLLYAFMFAHPGKKLLFMGMELAQREEWDAHRGLDWSLLQWEMHWKVRDFLRELNRMYRELDALHEIDFSGEGFEWIDVYDSDNSIVSFVRKGKDPNELVACVFNMTPVVRDGYRIGVPKAGTYQEILNSDAAEFGGSNAGTREPRHTEDVAWADKPCSFEVTLPPLGAVYYQYRSDSGGSEDRR